MWMATTDNQFALGGVESQTGPNARTIGFTKPSDVLSSSHLSAKSKREILAAWVSDASSVRDHPELRWLLGTPEPVALDEVQHALTCLELRSEASADDDELTQSGGEPVRIEVAPCGDGWAVRCAGILNEQLFRSGRAAEHAARRLGGRIADAGKWAEIHLHLRNGAVAGRFVCVPT